MRPAFLTRVFAAAMLAQVGPNCQAAEAPAPCVRGPNELAAHDYPALDARRRDGRTSEFDFARLSRCLQVDATMQAPALLVRLAETASNGLTLKLTSVSGKDATLPARVQLLDEAFKPLRDYPFDRFSKRSSDYSTTLFFNAADRTRYLLITPDTAWLGRINSSVSGNRWSTVWATATVIGTYSDGYETRSAIPFAPGGLIRVELEEDARVVDKRRR